MDRHQRGNPSAPLGKALKYARPEYERRFLLARLPDGDAVRVTRIADRYVVGTRLRLRRAVEEDSSGRRTIRKLTQKVPAAAGGPALITTIYLDPDEYEILAALPARGLSKTRYSLPPWGVDVFDPPLGGLVLAEAEFESPEDMEDFAARDEVLAEVTYDPRFTGGELVQTSAEAVADLVAAVVDGGAATRSCRRPEQP